LRVDLNARFGLGSTAFLKTPNFALDCDDIPRVEKGPTPSNRLTLQHLKPDTSLFPIPHVDARITGISTSLPANVLLDFVYGIAAYKQWGQKEMGDTLKDHFITRYQSIEPQVVSHGSDGMVQAMDDLTLLSMLVKGTTPGLKAAQRQEQKEAAVLRAKEKSQTKVQQWLRL